jgi:hypothetical protein
MASGARLSGTDASAVLIKKVNKQAQYDWSKGEATWSGDVKPDRAGPVKLQPGDLDAMLVNLAIARDVNAGKPLHYRMVDDGRAKDLVYTVAGKEKVTDRRQDGGRDQGVAHRRQAPDHPVDRAWPARPGAHPAAQGRRGRDRPAAEVNEIRGCASPATKKPRDRGAFFVFEVRLSRRA